MKKTLWLAMACACLSACNDESVASSVASKEAPEATTVAPQPKEIPVNTPSANEKPVSMTGTVVYKEIEGGFYAFISDEGKHFTLKGMSSDYHKNGLRITITGKPRPEVMTFTQFGTVFEVDKVKVVDASKVKPIHSTR